MMMKPSVAIAAVALLFVAGGSVQAAPKSAGCDRACLGHAMTAYLNAMAKHDPAAAPFAKDIRFTQDTKDLKLGEGLWSTVTGLGTYRVDILDVRAGIAGAHVVVEDAGKPALLAVRLKVVGRKIAEAETQVAHSAEEGQMWAPETLTAENPALTYKIKKSERNTREEMVKISDHYVTGLAAGSFVKVDAPFAEETTYRNENGVFTAGPPCTRAPNCKNIKTQPSPTRFNFQDRVMAVDEQKGIVWRRISWGRGNGVRLVAFELFKIYGGKMQAVEAFLRYEPLETTSGWG